ncbi:uncharacterized protein Z518_06909 [Rhinocladiella mackenziei CBS 650.93]|uniref:Mid2 domain-containing protein n=1 Tax=Rhinocladiella mackenziei CBS 650.93 TaxID=1442369 RepID=A0A0D2FMT2_9EURO|nr:uncharacterized protein Z518_06909 [Rhinocladiella mackenziei CBS 650.93]KIX03357.1 hypothetical protein Z518_06909 [Rhinocladiella mackenziei CBS 650.93]
MDYVPDPFFRGLRRSAAPDPASGNTPTTTSILNNAKITHALGKLAQAGVVDDTGSQIISRASTTSVSTEKITHVTEKLTQAGLSSDDEPAKSSSHGLATKYIIVIAVVSAVVLLALLTGGCLCWRRYKRRRAYNVVSRGVDKKGKGIVRDKEDMFNTDMQESESFNVEGQKLTERNFESGYDKVDTGYEGTGYGAVEDHGDKRTHFEA